MTLGTGCGAEKQYGKLMGRDAACGMTGILAATEGDGKETAFVIMVVSRFLPTLNS